MQMWSARVSGRTNRTDHIALSHALTALYIERAHVSIQRLEIISMINHDHISITVIVPTRIYDHAGIGRVHRFPFVTCNINAIEIGAGSVIKPGKIVLIRRPNERTVSDRTTADRVTCA